MTDARLSQPTRLTASQQEAVAALFAAEESRSGRRPLDESRRILVTSGSAADQWLLIAADGTALAYANVVDSVAELSGLDETAAAEILEAVRESGVADLVWTHGERSVARQAAVAAGLPVVRELLLLSAELPRQVRPMPADVSLRPFDAERDAEPWLALNRAAFVDLPDQASWSSADLQERLAAPWFDPDDFLLAVDAQGAVIGFHWTKIDPAATVTDDQGQSHVSGEVFVMAVAPERQGTGLAGPLLDAGLAHLARRGLTRVHLFVDASNRTAVRLYERAGFSVVDTDRMYRLRP